MSLNFTFEYDVDLSRTIQKTPINSVFSEGDKRAHRISLTIKRGNREIDLSGATVTGTFICHTQNVTVQISESNGSVDGNKASLVLSAGCYQTSGLCSILIHLSSETITNTVFVGTLLMNPSSTDMVLDPDDIIPSVSELIAEVGAMRVATGRATAAASSAEQASAAASSAATNATTAAVRADSAAEFIEDAIANAGLRLSMYPVGSWYFSDDPTSPAQLMGGTWEPVVGRALIGAGQYSDSITYTSGQKGGSPGKNITKVNLPADAVVSIVNDTGSVLSGLTSYSSSSGGDWAAGAYKTVTVRTAVNNDVITREALDVMQPYYATNIWRRIA